MLQIDYRSGEALYVQIKSNLKKLILTGSLKENEPIPSVRKLAAEFAINVNTVQRAYRELEQEGYIYSVPGKGNFVSKVNDDIFEKNLEEIKNELITVLKRARVLDISKEKIDNLVEEFFDKCWFLKEGEIW